jgi:maltooligosyltrehalose trehalohydrolase
MLTWYKKLIALRRAHPELTNGSFDKTQIAFSEEEKWLSMRRGSIEVIANLNADSRKKWTHARTQLLLASERIEARGDDWLVLPPDSVAILKYE